ncbi:MAG: hypothetical protein IJ173_09905, partial [Kiritimatiellae bacterium]|nr:hypothetical protein [Kiritimatiellia bacterium]
PVVPKPAVSASPAPAAPQPPPAPEPPKKSFDNRSDILNDPVLNDLLNSIPGATIADIKEKGQ